MSQMLKFFSTNFEAECLGSLSPFRVIHFIIFKPDAY